MTRVRLGRGLTGAWAPAGPGTLDLYLDPM